MGMEDEGGRVLLNRSLEETKKDHHRHHHTVSPIFQVFQAPTFGAVGSPMLLRSLPYSSDPSWLSRSMEDAVYRSTMYCPN